jgi:hypothetical protein
MGDGATRTTLNGVPLKILKHGKVSLKKHTRIKSE